MGEGEGEGEDSHEEEIDAADEFDEDNPPQTGAKRDPSANAAPKVDDQVLLKGLTGWYKKFNGKKGKVLRLNTRTIYYTVKVGLNRVSAKAEQLILLNEKPNIDAN